MLELLDTATFLRVSERTFMPPDWIVPLAMGLIFYLLSTARFRVISLGARPNEFARRLRFYGTIWAVGEGYIMLGLRALLDGTRFSRDAAAIVGGCTALWICVLVLIRFRFDR